MISPPKPLKEPTWVQAELFGGRVRKWAWKWETSCLCQSFIKLPSWRVVYRSTLRWWSGAPLCFLTCSGSDTTPEQITSCVYLPLHCCSLIQFRAINLNPVQSFILPLLYSLFVFLSLFLFRFSALFLLLSSPKAPSLSVSLTNCHIDICPAFRTKSGGSDECNRGNTEVEEMLLEPVSPPL